MRAKAFFHDPNRSMMVAEQGRELAAKVMEIAQEE
jgi:hypothetical protein